MNGAYMPPRLIRGDDPSHHIGEVTYIESRSELRLDRLQVTIDIGDIQHQVIKTDWRGSCRNTPASHKACLPSLATPAVAASERCRAIRLHSRQYV
jgi:hypothetical protein